MTDTKQRIRAVFLTALMVLSVFGGSIAFAGTAAAGSLGVTVAENDVGETTTYTAEYTVGDGISDISIDTIDFDTDGATGSVATEDVTVTLNGESVDVSGVSGTGTYTISLASGTKVSTGDSLTIEMKGIGVPATTGSKTASVSLTGSSTIDSASAGYSVVDSEPVISDVTATFDGTNVNVSFVSNQTLDAANVAVDLNQDGSNVNTLSGFTEVDLGNGNWMYYKDASPGVGVGDGEYSAVLSALPDADGAHDVADGQSDSVTIDTSAPKFDYLSPSDGAALKNVPGVIDIAINDSLSSVDTSSIRVEIWEDGSTPSAFDSSTDTMLVDRVDVTQADDGIQFSNGNLTIDPSSDAIPALPDGTIVVKVTAADSFGNSEDTATALDTESGSAPYAFTLDTGANFDFTLSTPADGDGDGTIVTGSPTQSVDVTISGETIDSANFTVSNSTGIVYSADESSGTYTGSGFSAEPGTATDFPELVAGQYTVTANATDASGNIAEESYTFTVDTDGPNVTSVEISDSAINSGDTSVDVNVTFDEEVDKSTVVAEVFTNSDATADKTLNSGATYINGDKTKVQFSGVDVTSPAVDNASALVKVTAAQDLIEGSATNNLDEGGETTFSIDSEGVSVDSFSPNNPITGYYNLTADTSFTTNGDDTTVRYFWAERGSSDFHEITNPEAIVAGSDVPEGAITLKANITDDAGNSHKLTSDVIVDTEQPQISGISDGDVAGTVDLSENVDMDLGLGEYVVASIDTEQDGDFNDTETTTDAGTDTVAALTGSNGHVLDTSALSDGDSFDLKLEIMNADGSVVDSKTVTLTVNRLNVNSIGAAQLSDGKVQVTVKSDEALTALSVYLNTSDNFRTQVDEELAFSNFENATTDPSTEYVYTYNVTASEYRDGEYEAEVISAADSTRSAVLPGSVKAGPVVVNETTPSLIDADITGYDSANSETDVELKFSEPLGSAPATADVKYKGTEAAGTTLGSDTGSVTVSFSGTIQTGTATDLNISASGLAGLDGASDTNADVSSVTLSTIELDLTEGMNAVSIPAASGSIGADELASHPNVESIWMYNAQNDSWVNYNPSASDNAFDTLEGGNGYLVKASGDAQIDLNVYNQPGGDDVESSHPTSQQLDAGWNLVGHYQEGSQSANDALSTIDNYGSVFKQSTAGNLDYSAVDTSADATGDSLQPGDAYWVFVNSENGDEYAETAY